MKAAIILTIKKNRDFHFLYRRGMSCVSDNLVTYVIKRRRSELNRLGITTSKKVGCAVRRNRARRVIKESYRKLLPCMYKGCDVVFVARTRTSSVSSNEIFASMQKHLNRLGCIKKSETFVSRTD
ncbi:MAG: ribonuclease P protein component [Oscillospiraceae bacterium]|jgi:ribonuclease P protein component|nr:ribonuclease P protein component [Oscillospiraceae bacterium]